MIYALGYPEYDAPVTARIDAFRAAHEPERAALVPPHVTLVFGVGDEHLEALAARLAQLTARTPAVTIAFPETEAVFDPFERKHKLFLRCGDGSAAVTRLHEAL